MSDFLQTIRARIDEAIGGRSAALALEKASDGRFVRTTVQRWIDGRTHPDVADLKALAEFTGKPIAWLLGLDEPAPFRERSVVEVPSLDVRAAAGHGRFNLTAHAVASFPFPREFIERLGGSPRYTECMRSDGDSMLPTIESGALLLVDRAQNMVQEPKKPARGRSPLPKDEIFVFIQGDALRIKRLRRLSRDFLAIISDNVSDHPPEILDRDEAARVKIIGKVIWWDNRL
jgi:phage repressor protein C with HTH and peptisase S24 domain